MEENTQNSLEGLSIDAKKPQVLPNGVHDGIIGNLKYRDGFAKNGKEYRYLDIVIDIEQDDDIITLKVGFPYNLTEVTVLGKFLRESGFKYNEGKSYKVIEIKNHLVNKKVTFQTHQETTDKGTFSNILRETIKFV